LNDDVDLTLGELRITSSVAIEGGGRIRIDGQGTSRVLRIDGPDSGPDMTVSLSGLTITGGRTAADGGDGGGAGIFTTPGSD
jgi:hypothetical protein